MTCCCKSKVRFIVLFGAPGAGKGTLAQYLLDNYDVVHFSTGNLLRNEVKHLTEIGIEVKSILGSGGLVGDDIVNRIVEKNILLEISGSSCVLLDGYPRTVEQAIFLDSIACGDIGKSLKVLELSVDDEVVVSRISKRRVCALCGATFGEVDGALTVCNRCGGNLIRRPDDEESTVRNRLKEYAHMTIPVASYYSNSNRLAQICGGGSPESVAKKVDEVLLEFGLKKR